MSAVMKYKVYEFGKDFGMSSTQVMDLIEKYFERPKNHMTALTDKELDMLFEYYTRERGHENFDKYVEILNTEKKTQPAPQSPAPAQKGAPARSAASGAPDTDQAKPAAVSAPPAPRKKKSGPRQIRGEVEKRIVDTKSVEVNLSKYDQKLRGSRRRSAPKTSAGSSRSSRNSRTAAARAAARRRRRRKSAGLEAERSQAPAAVRRAAG